MYKTHKFMKKERSIEIMMELLNYTGKNAKQFSEFIGSENIGWIYSVLDPKRPNTISKVKAAQIVAAFPEINLSYLLTGEGTLLRADKAENIQQNINSSHITQTGNIEAPTAQMDKLISVLAEQSQQVTKAQEQIDRLITIIENQSK